MEIQEQNLHFVFW